MAETDLGFPYPEDSAPINVAGDMALLASAVDAHIKDLDLSPPNRGNAQPYEFNLVNAEGWGMAGRPGQINVDNPLASEVTLISIAEEDSNGDDEDLLDEGDNRVMLEMLDHRGNPKGQTATYKIIPTDGNQYAQFMTVEFMHSTARVDLFEFGQRCNVRIYNVGTRQDQPEEAATILADGSVPMTSTLKNNKTTTWKNWWLEGVSNGHPVYIGNKDGFRAGWYTDNDHGYFQVSRIDASTNSGYSMEINTQSRETKFHYKTLTEGYPFAPGAWRDGAMPMMYVSGTRNMAVDPDWDEEVDGVMLAEVPEVSTMGVAQDLTRGQFFLNESGNIYLHYEDMDARKWAPNKNTYGGNGYEKPAPTFDGVLFVKDSARHVQMIYNIDKVSYNNSANHYVRIEGHIEWQAAAWSSTKIYYLKADCLGV